MEKRTYSIKKRSYMICEKFKCIYAADENCSIANDRKKAISECPDKLTFCAKAYCSHCMYFKTESCEREKASGRQEVKVTSTVIRNSK